MSFKEFFKRNWREILVGTIVALGLIALAVSFPLVIFPGMLIAATIASTVGAAIGYSACAILLGILATGIAVMLTRGFTKGWGPSANENQKEISAAPSQPGSYGAMTPLLATSQPAEQPVFIATASSPEVPLPSYAMATVAGQNPIQTAVPPSYMQTGRAQQFLQTDRGVEAVTAGYLLKNGQHVPVWLSTIDRKPYAVTQDVAETWMQTVRPTT